MGIQGLLPLLKSVMVPLHIKELEGCSVAVDTYSWLHKGALSCSTQLCKELPTTRHIDYCMHRVNLLRHYGVKPTLVFDGGLLPMKIEQENKRARARKENLARAVEHESNGNAAAAYECYQKAVDISPSIAHDLIQILKQENVSFVVAPYEADAQMTFLAISSQVDAVITEDSDLIPFGCPRVSSLVVDYLELIVSIFIVFILHFDYAFFIQIIFKMDKYGQGVEFQYSRLQQNKDLSFAGFTNRMLLEMCILSGCDYLQSLPGMGLKRAHALISKFKHYDKVIKHLKYSTVSVPPLYEESFHKAILTFQHQRVYDPTTEAMIHLSDLSDNDGDDLEFLGPMMPQHLAKGIAEGYLDPFTCMPFKERTASSEVALYRKSELKNVKPEKGRKKLDLPLQKNLLTKYFCFASLEAKREFTAPRKSPICPSPVDKFSPIAEEHCSVKNASSNMCSPSASSFCSENVESTPPADTVRSDIAPELLERLEDSAPGFSDEKGSSEHISPSNFGDSIHKPCEALLKECDNKNVSVVQDERSTQNKKVVSGNAYLKHQSVKNIDEDSEQENLLVKDDVASDTSNFILRSSYKTRIENNKVVVRSSYFQCKSSNNNHQENLQERPLLKADAVIDSDKNKDIIIKDASCNNSGIAVKRKASLNDSIQIENMKSKHMRASESLSENDCHAPNLDELGMKTEERKFGSDISHLNHYSDVADKSMERFVSVISSFRFSSTGSRASGLRAPLKDIRNTYPNRSNPDVDFSRFAYTPKNKNSGV
ncbi:exonuclease 1 isoform X2 [Euphorbia lathyris]|uniref:exonuclease 1 isoform X2 n=1 Tax=Euphorbia lathyris TaxID=212925 RepID=UPI0033131025